MPKSMLRKVQSLTIILLIVASTITVLSFIPQVKAETKIIAVTPTSGTVGTLVQVTANISTTDGTYVVQFDGENVTSGTAVGNSTTASFSVPHAPEGAHNVTIIDNKTGENNTATFQVLISYSFSPLMPVSPVQVQEGGNVTVFANMTGGSSNYTYPNVKVQTPSGNTTYEMVGINITTDVVGDFYRNLTYPTDFSTGANTNFTGEYYVLFNETVVNQFFIGLTNSSEYHRGDFVNVKAVDYYPPSENVTVTIKLGDKMIDSVNSTATDGVVEINWLVPLNATINDYSLNITSVPSSKVNASDIQIFRVPGFKTEIFTFNLANKTVASVFVKVYDNSANTTSSTTTSGSNGSAISMLEVGDYSGEAFSKEVKVGEMNFTVEKEGQVNFTCQLVTMNINVIDEQNVSIPYSPISLSYNYTTNLSVKQNKTDTESGETDITGVLQLPSLLPNVTCMINASRYGNIFNQGNDTVFNLPSVAYFDVAVICPLRTLRVNVVDGQNQPIPDVTVNARESMGGLLYSQDTDVSGTAVLNCTFGRYSVMVYEGEIPLNETTVDLFQNQNISVPCQLYGLNVSVKIVDYFGRPIALADVTLQLEGQAPIPKRTRSDGTATFDGAIGGNLQITLQLPGQTQPYMTNSFYVDNSTMIQIKVDKYVLLAGFFVETSQFLTLIIILATLVLILSIEVYRRRHIKPQKNES